jgi:hypothetical protein
MHWRRHDTRTTRGGLSARADARAMRRALSDRMAKFGRNCTRRRPGCSEFGRHARKDRGAEGLGKLETFEFSGSCTLPRSDRQGKYQLRTPHVREEDAGEARAHQSGVPESAMNV